MFIKVPEKANYILEKLESQGFEAYVVGGCVRDSLSGILPHDWDICTSAKPEQVLECFSEYSIRETGIKHGTVTVKIETEKFEVTTFRLDGEYLDHRHPTGVEFVQELQKDLSRRDFTINAIAYHPDRGIKDFFGGQEDLKNHIIKCVGVPDTRFKEDALRILRGLRFAAVFKFEIEPETQRSIHSEKLLLLEIASERFRMEFKKLLEGKGAVKIFHEYKDIFIVLIPEIQWMDTGLWENRITAFSHAPRNEIIRLSILLQNVSNPNEPQKHSAELASDILYRLKYSKVAIKEISALIEEQDIIIKPIFPLLKRILNRIPPERLYDLMVIRRANILALKEVNMKEQLESLNSAQDCLDRIIEENQCYQMEDLAINGKDLKMLGITNGRQIGKTLTDFLDMVIDEKLLNEYDVLMGEAYKILERRNINGQQDKKQYKNRHKGKNSAES